MRHNEKKKSGSPHLSGSHVGALATCSFDNALRFRSVDIGLDHIRQRPDLSSDCVSLLFGALVGGAVCPVSGRLALVCACCHLGVCLTAFRSHFTIAGGHILTCYSDAGQWVGGSEEVQSRTHQTFGLLLWEGIEVGDFISERVSDDSGTQ